MIALKCEQGSEEWFQARLGIPTASCFDKLVTPGLKPSGQADEYLDLLLAEYATGQGDEDSFSGFWMERGTELEPEARLGYQLLTGHKVTQVGLCYKDKKKLVSCSPDGLIYEGRKLIKGAEIKCPKARNHGAYYIRNRCPKKYGPQVQGSMWVTGCDTWDFVSYHPDYDQLIVTVEKDPAMQRALDDIIPEFIERMLEDRQSDRVQALREQRIEQEAA